jgi:hypothetical protein
MLLPNTKMTLRVHNYWGMPEEKPSLHRPARRHGDTEERLLRGQRYQPRSHSEAGTAAQHHNAGPGTYEQCSVSSV